MVKKTVHYFLMIHFVSLPVLQQCKLSKTSLTATAEEAMVILESALT